LRKEEGKKEKKIEWKSSADSLLRKGVFERREKFFETDFLTVKNES
jgi:hypothetical protein